MARPTRHPHGAAPRFDFIFRESTMQGKRALTPLYGVGVTGGRCADRTGRTQHAADGAGVCEDGGMGTPWVRFFPTKTTLTAHGEVN